MLNRLTLLSGTTTVLLDPLDDVLENLRDRQLPGYVEIWKLIHSHSGVYLGHFYVMGGVPQFVGGGIQILL